MIKSSTFSFFRLIVLSAILAAIKAMPVSSETESFECMANYLRDKKLLDKNFKYFVQSEPLECDSYITTVRDTMIQKLIEKTTKSSSEESEETEEFRNVTSETADCFRQQLSAINYPEDAMKLFIYSKSSKLSKKQKKKLLTATESDILKKFQITMSICMSDAIFGEMFDDMMKEESEDGDLEEKQNDYCIRKYVIDNGIIDPIEYTINLNPDNIELNFQCDVMVEDLFEIFEETVKEAFENESMKSRKQLRCLSRAIRNEDAVKYMVKISVLSEVSLSDEQTADLRTEFITNFQKLYLEMIKCY